MECSNGVGKCFDGTCQTPDGQCKKIWGETSAASNTCMQKFNIQGNYYGYCSESSDTYNACSANDAVCGLQHCVGGNDNPEIPAGGIEIQYNNDKCKIPSNYDTGKTPFYLGRFKLLFKI